jgi:hypothetical protein
VTVPIVYHYKIYTQLNKYKHGEVVSKKASRGVWGSHPQPLEADSFGDFVERDSQFRMLYGVLYYHTKLTTRILYFYFINLNYCRNSVTQLQSMISYDN